VFSYVHMTILHMNITGILGAVQIAIAQTKRGTMNDNVQTRVIVSLSSLGAVILML
jgi:hypothetical protein